MKFVDDLEVGGKRQAFGLRLAVGRLGHDVEVVERRCTADGVDGDLGFPGGVKLRNNLADRLFITAVASRRFEDVRDHFEFVFDAE